MTNAASPATVLVVEDEPEILELVASALASEGYKVVRATNGREAIERLEHAPPDVVVLDLLLPEVGGIEVLEHIRARGATPVILVTALETEDHRVHGLQLGADDYVVKPFSVRELVARVAAVLRRASVGAPARRSTIEYPGLRLDLDARQVFVREVLVEMTAKEFDLLAFLAASPGRVFTRPQMLREVWQSSSEWQQEGTVTEHVRRLRLKVEVDAEHPKWLQTVRGVGYRFERRHASRSEPAAG